MKNVLKGLSMAVLALVAGCATMQPVQLKAETPNLNIAGKKALKVAVVVQDPMAYTLFYRGVAGKYTRDMTPEMRSAGLALESELSRVSVETFSQAFNQVVALRDLPQPGQYDAVVNLSIGKVLMQESVSVTGESCDTTAEWNMSVLDKQNKEVLSKKGVSPMHNFGWSAFNPRPGFSKGITSVLSLIIPELAKEWGTALYSLNLAP